MLLSAYLTFSLSQFLGLSGIVSLFLFGVVLAQYNWYNLSESSKIASKVTFGTMSKLAESCVFIYLGVVAALAFGRFHWHFGLVLYSLLVIAVARAAHIFPFSILLNMGRVRKIHRNMSLMLWVSGLRGAIAFALSLRIPCPDVHGSQECRNSDLFVTTTISIVVFTTMGVGTAMERVATALNAIQADGGGDVELFSSVYLAMGEKDSSGLSEHLMQIPDQSDPSVSGNLRDLWLFQSSARGSLYQAFARFDNDYLQPMFGGPSSSGSALEESQLNKPQLVKRADETLNLPKSEWCDEEEPPACSRSVIFE